MGGAYAPGARSEQLVSTLRLCESNCCQRSVDGIYAPGAYAIAHEPKNREGKGSGMRASVDVPEGGACESDWGGIVAYGEICE
uniref:Uncharacterized protein n=1 Tax=Parascaris univalens TaxID=6257 RepID=A0A915A5C8_PARUN